MAVRHSDPVTGLYRLLLLFAGVGILILVAGVAEFAYFEPSNPSGLRATIVGVYHYDRTSHQTTGSSQEVFARADLFAAVVDWSNLPDTITVQAIWFDSFENVVGSAGPDRPSALRDHTIIPAEVQKDLHYHLPGQYIFAIERVVRGQPVEVLARRIIEVQRT